MQRLESIFEDIAKENQYKIPGKPETYREYNQGWNDCVEKLKEALGKDINAPTNNGWIPVEERLPEECEWVFITLSDDSGQRRSTGVSFYSNGSWEANIWEIDEVIAWQPLPEPYKSKGE